MHFNAAAALELIEEVREGLIGCGEHQHELELLNEATWHIGCLNEEALEKEELERRYGGILPYLPDDFD